MGEMKLRKVPIAFTDALVEAKAIGDGAARFNAKFIIEPGSEHEKLLDAEILKVAKEKWKDEKGKDLPLNRCPWGSTS